jgi:hypothetical protein
MKKSVEFKQKNAGFCPVRGAKIGHSVPIEMS